MEQWRVSNGPSRTRGVDPVAALPRALFRTPRMSATSTIRAVSTIRRPDRPPLADPGCMTGLRASSGVASPWSDGRAGAPSEKGLGSRAPPHSSSRRTSEVVLHAGMGKTGTTTIQALLHRNRRRLSTGGVLYPASPAGVATSGSAWRAAERRPADLGRLAVPGPVLAGRAAAGRRAGAPGRGPTVGRPDPAALRRGALRRLAAGHGDPARHARGPRLLGAGRPLPPSPGRPSLQSLPAGRAAQRLGPDARRASGQGPGRTLYDYRARLDAWRSLLRPDDLVVRRFERQTFAGGSLTSTVSTRPASTCPRRTSRSHPCATRASTRSPWRCSGS